MQARAHEHDVRFHPMTPDRVLERAALGPLTDDDEEDVGPSDAGAGDGRDEQVEALELDEVADGKDDRSLRRQPELPARGPPRLGLKLLRSTALGYHGYLPRGAPQRHDLVAQRR
jgi:hypothetical protein